MAAAAVPIMLGLQAYQTYKSLTDKPQAPTLPTAPKPLDTSSAASMAARQKRKASSAYGMRSTLLTGPAGVTAAPPVQRQTLLGS